MRVQVWLWDGGGGGGGVCGGTGASTRRVQKGTREYSTAQPSPSGTGGPGRPARRRPPPPPPLLLPAARLPTVMRAGTCSWKSSLEDLQKRERVVAAPRRRPGSSSPRCSSCTSRYRPSSCGTKKGGGIGTGEGRRYGRCFGRRHMQAEGLEGLGGRGVLSRPSVAQRAALAPAPIHPSIHPIVHPPSRPCPPPAQPTCTDSATAATAWCAAAAAGDTSGWLLASVSSGGMRAGRWEWMAAPAERQQGDGGAGRQGG